MLLASCAALPAQDKVLPPAPDRVEKAEKKDAGPAKYDREGSQFVPWTLAAVGIIIVMILVCMPVRRE